ncbi:MAG: tyrosine phosphatase family protein [Lentisphaeria bacterium]
MKIVVCPLSRVIEMIEIHAPERIVSMINPGCNFPESGPAYAGRHLRMSFHDIGMAEDGLIEPSAGHVEELLAFLADWERSSGILIHCNGGVSRSTAVAFMAACLHNSSADEREIALALRCASPVGRPNRALVRMADEALGRSGRMIAAIEDTAHGLPEITAEENEPFTLPAVY